MTYGEVMNTIQKIELDTAKLLINGQFIESKTQEWQDIVNPATQEVIGRVPFATVEEVDAAIQAAQDAFASWRQTPIQASLAWSAPRLSGMTFLFMVQQQPSF